METAEPAGPIEESVAAAIAARPAATVDPRDAALIALALSYARLLDAPAPAAKYADAMDWLDGQDAFGSQDQATKRALKTLRSALAEHSVHSDLGPKLQACLESLRLSPKVRTVGQLRGGNDEPAGAPTGLDQLRARRDRKRHPPAVDPSSS